MASAKEPILTFSNQHGENISLSKDLTEAQWFLRQSGSYVYAKQCLEPKKQYLIFIGGSGHLDVGIATTNPKDIEIHKRHPSFRRMNEIKIHKRNLTISLKIQNNEIVSHYDGNMYKLKLEKGKSAWIAIYPKFGEINVAIKCTDVTGTVTSPMQFSRNTGYNIRLEDDDVKALTIHKNPAAICFPSCLLQMNHIAVFQCAPLVEKEKCPSRFHLKIMVYKDDPKSLVKNFRGVFCTSAKLLSDPPWTCIDLIDRDICIGNISVKLASNNVVTCSVNDGYKKEMSLPFDASKGIWLIFELYRVSLRFISILEGSEMEAKETAFGASGTGNDQLDSSLKLYDGNENMRVDDQVSLHRYQELFSDRNITNQQENGASGHAHGELADVSVENLQQSFQKGIDAIHKRIDAIDKNVVKVVDVVRQRSLSGECLSPDEPFPPTSTAVKLNFRINMVKLVRDLNAGDIIDHWFQESIISQNLYEKVNQMQAQKTAVNRELLQNLLGKEVDRNVFERTLKDSEQEHLISLFFQGEMTCGMDKLTRN